VNLTPDIEYLIELCHDAGAFAMLKAYFDESGIHAGAPVCVVCGLVLPAQRAAWLSRDWQNEVLFKHRVPYFHAKEFAQRSGPFRGWKDAAIRDFAIDALATINAACSLDELRVGAAIFSRDFHCLSIDERRWLTGGQFVLSGTTRKWRKMGAPSKPYFLLFQQTMLDAVKHTQDKDCTGRALETGEVVHFVFDRQEEYEPTARAFNP